MASLDVSYYSKRRSVRYQKTTCVVMNNRDDVYEVATGYEVEQEYWNEFLDWNGTLRTTPVRL